MHPETQLTILASFAGFLLKTSLGFLICWGLAKAVVEARRKFLVWFSYLAASALYWLWMLQSLARQHLPTALNTPAPASAVSPLAALQIGHFWLAPIAIFLRCLAVIYFLALAYFLFTRIKKHLHLKWILQFASRPPEHIENIFRPIARALGFPNVRLLVLPGIYSPATFGWIKPTVLVPTLCLEQENAELNDIFRHELQHIRRHDSIFIGIASLCRALLFFHPAVAYAMHRLALDSELACDVAVVGNSPERRATYAESLIRFARLRVAGEPAPWNLDFAGSSSQLKFRIRSMLTGNRIVPRRMIVLRGICGVLLLLGFLTAAPSLFVVFSSPQPPNIQPPTITISAPVLETRSHRHANPARRTQASTDAAIHIPHPAAAQPAELATEETPSTNKPHTRASTAGDPALKTRNQVTTSGASKYPAGSTVILSDQPSYSSDSTSRRAAIASAVAAGAGEAARVSSHGRDREVH